MKNVWILWTCVLILPIIKISECRKNKFVAKVPEHCEGQSFCEEVLNYPHDFVEDIINDLKRQGYYWALIGEGQAKDPFRRGFDYIDLCASTFKRAIPKAVRDEIGEWRFVLHHEPTHVQVLDVEICKYSVRGSGANATCGKDVPDLQIEVYPGYESRCQQSYLQRKVVALNDRGELIMIPVSYPCCCNCVVVQD